MTRFLLFCLVLVTSMLDAQSPAEIAAIKGFCGCFEVDFRYKETFATDDNYEFHDPYQASALELVVAEEETADKLVLQHILIINDTMFIKHWREDWEYEPDQAFTFLGNNTWEAMAIEGTTGQWSQEVYGTDDTPRYSGAATWFLADGKQVWENTADCPLPRREYTKRDDYHLMRRTNRLIVEDWGWIHEQDNEKVILTEKGEKVLVEEKGRNTYRRTEMERCQAAADWWATKGGFWQEVRYEWNQYLAQPRRYTVHKKQGEDFLPYELHDLEEQTFSSPAATRAAIQKTLAKYRQEVKGVQP